MNASWIILLIVIGIDALSNLFLLVFYPKWEQVKKEEIDEIREQNEELRALTRELLRGME